MDFNPLKSSASRAAGAFNLPQIPPSGTTIQPLMSPDDIYPAELAVINSTKPGEDLYLVQYTLPGLKDGATNGTPASDAQRQILPAIVSQIKNGVHVYIVADNEGASSNATEGNGAVAATARIASAFMMRAKNFFNGTPEASQPHNQATINYLHQMGANILPYPMKYVSIDHTKVVSNNNYAVVASANESKGQSDDPANNTGFLFAGAAAHNVAAQAFLPQWNFAVREDTKGWASGYSTPNLDATVAPDPNVTVLNTAPAAESGSSTDTTQIKQAYLNLINKAANGPSNASLYLEQFDVSDPDIINALLSAKQQNPGLTIGVIQDPNQYNQDVKMDKTGTSEAENAHNQFLQAGIQNVFANVNPHPVGDRFPQQFHDKWIAYLDPQNQYGEVVNGSGNLSESAMEANNGSRFKRNREVDVDVIDYASAQAYAQKYQADLANTSSDPAVAAQNGNQAAA